VFCKPVLWHTPTLFHRRFVEFSKAFHECKGSFDVIINCVSASLDFSGMMGMLGNDGVAVQVSLGFLFVCMESRRGAGKEGFWGSVPLTRVTSRVTRCEV